jgi:hypothetical protein
MFARAGLLCALLAVLAGAAAAAGDGRLLLGDKTAQSPAEIDFSALPVWHSLFKCGDRLTTESCLLQRMTENPTGTARSLIIGTALNLAAQIERGRADSPDGFASLRASQAYLVAAAFEAETNRNDEARIHYRLASTIAGEVPPKITNFNPTYRLQTGTIGATDALRPGVTNPAPDSRVIVGARAVEEPVKFFGEAQLVREYATRALAALGAN